MHGICVGYVRGHVCEGTSPTHAVVTCVILPTYDEVLFRTQELRGILIIIIAVHE